MKQEYIDLISDNFKTCLSSEWRIDGRIALGVSAGILARNLKRVIPKFNEKKFLKNCGVEELREDIKELQAITLSQEKKRLENLVK